jgi:hypothetical protein
MCPAGGGSSTQFPWSIVAQQPAESFEDLLGLFVPYKGLGVLVPSSHPSFVVLHEL